VALPARVGNAYGFDIVIAGHSHHPSSERRDGVLIFNPGSAGPRRFHLPVSVGRLTISPAGVRSRILRLDTASARRAKALS